MRRVAAQTPATLATHAIGPARQGSGRREVVAARLQVLVWPGARSDLRPGTAKLPQGA